MKFISLLELWGMVIWGVRRWLSGKTFVASSSLGGCAQRNGWLVDVTLLVDVDVDGFGWSSGERDEVTI